MLDTLRYVRHETDVWFEITTLLIPGVNDADDELDALTRWVVDELGPDVPMHFTAFHPDWRMREHPLTSGRTVRRARTIARRNGVASRLHGQRSRPGGRSDHLHGVRRPPLIARDGYRLTAWHLDDAGRCRSCGAPCAGVFEGGPRATGARAGFPSASTRTHLEKP